MMKPSIGTTSSATVLEARSQVADIASLVMMKAFLSSVMVEIM